MDTVLDRAVTEVCDEIVRERERELDEELLARTLRDGVCPRCHYDTDDDGYCSMCGATCGVT